MIQLELRDPVVAVRGDRYILRRPSPGETLGGGVIVDHQPKGRHKRFDQEVLRSLHSLSQGTPAEILMKLPSPFRLRQCGRSSPARAIEASNAEPALQELLLSHLILPLEEGELNVQSDLLVVTLPHWNSLRNSVMQTMETYHASYPLRRGIPREELKSRLKLPPRVFNALIHNLVSQGLIIERSPFLAKPDHEISFDPAQQNKIHNLERRLNGSPINPPSLKECQAEVGVEIMNALLEIGSFIAVSNDVVFRRQEYVEAVGKVQEMLRQNEEIALAEVRDLLGTSRKYAQALLEHLDAIGVTIRDGDFRRLKKK